MTASCPTCADDATAVTLQDLGTDQAQGPRDRETDRNAHDRIVDQREHESDRLARGVDCSGNVLTCDLSLLEAPKIGDVVLVHAGVAIAFYNNKPKDES